MANKANKTLCPHGAYILMGKIDIKQTYKDSQFSSVQSLRHVGLFAIPWTAACQASLSITNSQFSAVQSLSWVRLFVTPWTVVCQASLSITNSWNLPKLMSIKLEMPSSHLILCCPLLLLPPIPPSIRVFSNESTLWHEVAKVLEFQL